MQRKVSRSFDFCIAWRLRSASGLWRVRVFMFGFSCLDVHGWISCLDFMFGFPCLDFMFGFSCLDFMFGFSCLDFGTHVWISCLDFGNHVWTSCLDFVSKRGNPVFGFSCLDFGNQRHFSIKIVLGVGASKAFFTCQQYSLRKVFGGSALFRFGRSVRFPIYLLGSFQDVLHSNKQLKKTINNFWNL